MVEGAAVVLGQSVAVAEEKAAAAFDAQQLKLSAAGSAPVFVDLLLLFLLLLLLRLYGINLFENRLGLLLTRDGLRNMSDYQKSYFLKHWEHMLPNASFPKKLLHLTHMRSRVCSATLVYSFIFITTIITSFQQP